MELAAPDLRVGRRAGCRLRRAADAGGYCGGLAAAGGLHRGDGVRAVVHRRHHAGAGRARGYGHAARAEDGLHPAAGGPRHRSAARGGGLLCTGDRHRDAADKRGDCRGFHRLPCGCRPVAAQSDVPRACGGERARGDDGGSPACGARRGPVDATRWPLHGDGGLSRRRAAGGVDVPASARGRYRAVPRHPARAVLPQRGHVARPRRDRARVADHRRGCAGLHGGEGDRHLCRGAAVQVQACGGSLPGGAVCAGRRVCVRAVRGRGVRWASLRRETMRPLRPSSSCRWR